MALEVLKEIRRAEKQAQDLYRKAQTEGDKKLLTAEKARARAIEKAKLQAKERIEQKISQASQQAQQAVLKLKEKGKKTEKALREQAEGRMEKALEIVLGRFYE